MRREESRIRLDPWAAEYEGAIQIGDEVAARVPEADVFKGFTDD